MLQRDLDRDLDGVFMTIGMLLVGILAATGLGVLVLTVVAAWVMKGPY